MILTFTMFKDEHVMHRQMDVACTGSDFDPAIFVMKEVANPAEPGNTMELLLAVASRVDMDELAVDTPNVNDMYRTASFTLISDSGWQLDTTRELLTGDAQSNFANIQAAPLTALEVIVIPET